ncbi:MAG: hypothetical protein AABZ47_00840 [Planctomycetota bacterium]
MDDLPKICRSKPIFSLLIVSIAALHLELLLIRWIGTEIRIFAYLQNSIMVVCFLGLGLGCFTSSRTVAMRSFTLPLSILVGLLSVPTVRSALNHVGERFGAAGDFLIWNHLVSDHGRQALWFVVQGLAVTYVLMFLTCITFVPLGRLIGRLLSASPRPILAYSVNVAGSLVGIWLFVFLSATGSSPFVWVLVLALLMAWFAGTTPRRGMEYAASLAVVVLISWWGSSEPGAVEVRWSPYQKLVLRHPPQDQPIPGKYLIEVNNVGYQGIVDTHADSSDPDRAATLRQGLSPALHGLSQYDLPTLVHPNPKRVLLVGAGAGNDAAGALRGGSRDITAVEIDPAIVELGRKYHPEGPYGSSGIRVVVDDARAYFARSTETFDVISFGLLDAHTQTTLTNGRLDHFVYTRESIHKARQLLAPGGVMLLSFEPQRPYIADRIARTLAEEFGEDPLIFRISRSVVGWGGVMYIAGDLGAVQGQMERVPALREFINDCQRAHPVSLGKVTPVTTDDWPYLYLKNPGIPILFYLLAGLMIVLVWHGRRFVRWTVASTPWRREHLHFFALGAGFLLLEVHNVSRSSVVLGTSWLANAVVFSGVLIMILLANAAAGWWPRIRSGPLYVLLVAICLALYGMDLSALSGLSYVWRVVAVGLVTSLPIAFSGIIFIGSFARTSSKHEALGANLLGSVLGSMLQALTFILGLKSIVLIVIAFYLVAALTRPRWMVAEGR